MTGTTNGPVDLRVLAVTNQKGGVGKTTTAINLGTALALVGVKVLILDLDPQGNASTGLGIAADDRAATMYDVMVGSKSLADVSRATDVANLTIVPGNADLVGIETELMTAPDRPFRLRDAVTTLAGQQRNKPRTAAISYILIDCPPSLNLLTLNAMVAAHAVLVPVQCEFFALEGISQLKANIDQIKATLNPGLEIQGVVLTMHDARTAFSKEVSQNVRAFFGPKVYETAIPRNIRIAEAPSHGKPVLLYDPSGPGSQAYMNLANEIVERERRYKAA